MATDDMISEHPDVVQRFVDASIKGWVDYLYGDPSPANALIKKDNPEMTDALLAHGLETLKTYGIIDSGDTEKLGIGAMTEARWQAFYNEMKGTGVFPDDIDVHSAFTLEFVDRGIGNDLKAELLKK
jgi:NitT/TauT family transport system substrate-binding protein